MAVDYSADGEFQFSYQCPRCKEFIRWRVFATMLQHQALMNDFRSFSKEATPVVTPHSRRPPKPPIRVSTSELTGDDKTFLKQCNIVPWDKK